MTKADNLLQAARCALADLEGIAALNGFDLAGDEPAAVTIRELREAIKERDANEPTHKEGICPDCGGEVEYTGETSLDGNEVLHEWYCPRCKLSGAECCRSVFQQHYLYGKDE